MEAPVRSGTGNFEGRVLLAARSGVPLNAIEVFCDRRQVADPVSPEAN